MSTPERQTVRSQAEFDAALAALGDTWGIIEIRSERDVWIQVRDTRNATVEAWGSATVEAWDSATVRASGSATVEAWDSATVEAWDSATVRASGSATVRAWGSATVRAWDSATVEASPFVAVHLHSSLVEVEGGVVIDVTEVDDSPQKWAEYHGVEVTEHDDRPVTAVLYKAVNDELRSSHNFEYPVGQTVECTDWWDADSCGNGLHLSPRPVQAKSYFPSATRFLACEVVLDDVRVLTGSGAPKIKVKRLTVLHEVDLDGKELRP